MNEPRTTITLSFRVDRMWGKTPAEVAAGLYEYAEDHKLLDFTVAIGSTQASARLEELADSWVTLAARNEAAQGRATKVAGYYRRCAAQLRTALEATT